MTTITVNRHFECSPRMYTEEVEALDFFTLPADDGCVRHFAIAANKHEGFDILVKLANGSYLGCTNMTLNKGNAKSTKTVVNRCKRWYGEKNPLPTNYLPSNW